MKFAQTFIKHHVMTILLYILVVVFGFYSFQNLPLALMPSMEVPAAVCNGYDTAKPVICGKEQRSFSFL